MPGYGILPAEEGGGLLPWSWAEERLKAARRYWLATVCPDGRPHAMAVWAVWLDGALRFSTGGHSRKARNLARDARCVVTTESGEEAVVVEGVAERIEARADRDRMERAYADKYGSGYPSDSWLFAVRPVVVFGFIEREDEFGRTATRWSWEEEARANR
jgi:PPOX class probable F420-dependent enzyme